MGEGFKYKVGKAFRHRADALFERQFKERNLFSERPEIRRTHYRFRLTNPAAQITPGMAVMLADEGQPALGVWCSNQRIGELDPPSSANLRRAFVADPLAGCAVCAVVQAQPTLSGYCQATVQESD